MPQDEKPEEKTKLQDPTQVPPAERTLELPAVIIGERGEKHDSPQIRLLPGRVRESVVLYPVYASVGAAAVMVTHFTIDSGEWHPFMVTFGWGLLFCWYWIYGVAYRYRRWVMKYFSLFMSAITAISLILITAVRGTAMAVPQDGTLVIRSPQPLLFIAAGLTTFSLAAILSHVVYLGRGYRQKRLDDHNEERSKNRDFSESNAGQSESY